MYFSSYPMVPPCTIELGDDYRNYYQALTDYCGMADLSDADGSGMLKHLSCIRASAFINQTLVPVLRHL